MESKIFEASILELQTEALLIPSDAIDMLQCIEIWMKSASTDVRLLHEKFSNTTTAVSQNTTPANGSSHHYRHD